jgi:uncharacterized protein (DUF58 family)
VSRAAAERPLRPFPLVPRFALEGTVAGTHRALRRGRGYEPISARPYRRGDPTRLIDWAASARLSAARGSDEFVIRENRAEETPRVVVVEDRRPAMALQRPPLPWLHKPAVVEAAAETIRVSVRQVRGALARVADADAGALAWEAPSPGRRAPAGPYDAPDDFVARAFALLRRRRRDLPSGTFVFVLSDFLAPPPDRVWIEALARRWDVVPVVIQDPVWESSFPPVAGVVVPVQDPRSGEVRGVRMRSGEVRRRAEENAARQAALLHGMRSLTLDPVLLETDDAERIAAAFTAWAAARVARRRR